MSVLNLTAHHKIRRGYEMQPKKSIFQRHLEPGRLSSHRNDEHNIIGANNSGASQGRGWQEVGPAGNTAATRWALKHCKVFLSSPRKIVLELFPLSISRHHVHNTPIPSAVVAQLLPLVYSESQITQVANCLHRLLSSLGRKELSHSEIPCAYHQT